MTRSIKAQQLSVRLDRLAESLGPSSATASVKPMARKIDEGNDRWGGYP